MGCLPLLLGGRPRFFPVEFVCGQTCGIIFGTPTTLTTIGKFC